MRSAGRLTVRCTNQPWHGPPAAARPQPRVKGLWPRPHHVVLVQTQPVDVRPLPVHGLPEGLDEQVLCSEQEALNAWFTGYHVTTQQEVTKGDRLGLFIHSSQEFLGS